MQLAEIRLRDAFIEKLAATLPRLDWHYGMSDDPWINKKGEIARRAIEQDLQLLSKLDGGYAAANKLWDEHRPFPISGASTFLTDPSKYTKIAEKYVVPPEAAGELLDFIKERLKQGDRYAIFHQDTLALTKERLHVIAAFDEDGKLIGQGHKREEYVEQSLYTMQSVVERVIAQEKDKENVLKKVGERLQEYEREDARSNRQERSR